MSKSGILLAVLAIGLIVAIWAVSSATKKITQTPETFTVGEEFIEDLSANNIDAAIALAVSDLQTADSKVALATFAQQHADVLNASTEVHLTGRGVDNDLRYAYGTVTSGSTESPLYMEFMDENGETRVSYFSFNQDDIPDYSNSDASNDE